MEGDDTIISFCKFVKLSVGVVVTSVQFVMVRSEFCCNFKFMRVSAMGGDLRLFAPSDSDA